MSKVADVFLKMLPTAYLSMNVKLINYDSTIRLISKKSEAYTNSLRLLRTEACGKVIGDVTQTKRLRPL